MTETSSETRKGLLARSRWIWIIGAVVLLTGAGATAYYMTNGSTAAESLGPLATVQRGPMLVTINEKGEVTAGEREVIRNELPWSATILFIADNGTPVEKGDKLLEFECQRLETELEEEQLEYDSAQEGLLRAERNLELKRKELDNQLTNARQAVRDAKADLERYRQGQYPMTLGEHKQEIAIAERDRRLAEEKLNFKLKINEDPKLGQPYSENDLKAEQLRVDRLKLTEQRAKSKLEMLIKYDHPRQVRRLESAVRTAQLRLERAELERQAQLSIAETQLKYKRKNCNDSKEELEELTEYRDNYLVIRASRDGYVDHRQDGPWWRWKALKVGTEISRKHQLMIIPDITSLQIRTQVFEAMIERVKAKMRTEQGVKAFVKLESRPDEVLTGKVSWVAPQPESQDRRRNPGVKVFRVIIELDGDPEELGLTTNMSCDVEMVLDRLDNVLQVPVAAVFTENKKHFVYKVEAGRSVKTYVTVGGSNEKRVEILSGLTEGDRVRLTPPAEGGMTGDEQEQSEQEPAVPEVESPDDQDDDGPGQEA
jgi:multidrug efflux pump subunit AcrA (membrane-fusion protein)